MLYRKSVLTVLLVLISFSFFGTLGLSVRIFPDEYDWRTRVISNLLSPRDNPSHYWLPAWGIALTMFLMLPFAAYLQRNLEIVSRLGARFVSGTFALGCVLVICACFVAPQHMREMSVLPRLHEFLARFGVGFLVIGMFAATWYAWKGFRKNLIGARLAWAWALIVLLPLAAIFIAQGLLLFAEWNFSFALPIRAALKNSVFWHLAFWEWAGSSIIFVFLSAAVILTPPGSNEQRSRPNDLTM